MMYQYPYYGFQFYKDKIVSWLSHLYNRNPYTWNDAFILKQGPWDWFRIKMPSYQNRNSHCFEIRRSSHNGISHIRKTSLYRIRTQVIIAGYQVHILLPDNQACRQAPFQIQPFISKLHQPAFHVFVPYNSLAQDRPYFNTPAILSTTSCLRNLTVLNIKWGYTVIRMYQR